MLLTSIELPPKSVVNDYESRVFLIRYIKENRKLMDLPPQIPKTKKKWIRLKYPFKAIR